MLVYISGILLFIKSFYEMLVDPDTIMGRYGVLDGVVLLGVMILTSVPVFIIGAFSVKYNDNIRQLVNISSYIRVFYEAPSFFDNKTEECEDKSIRSDLFGWELLHCNFNLTKGKKMAFEYVLIAIISCVLSIVSGIAFLLSDMASNFSQYETIGKVFLILSAVIALFYVVFTVLKCVEIRRNTDTEKLFAVCGQVYCEQYLETAEELQILTQEQRNIIEDYLQIKNKKDEDLQGSLENKTKRCFELR